MCTKGEAYIAVENYRVKKFRAEDNIRFELKSSQSSGVIMHAAGSKGDYIYVAYNGSKVLIYHIDLGSGEVDS